MFISKIHSLLLLALFAFGTIITSVAARPRLMRFQNRRSDSAAAAVDLAKFDTNMKRFAAGLPPLPPAGKRKGPTRVDSARRATSSQCAKSGVIEVIDTTTNVLRGYLSSDLKANQHYGLSLTLAGAGTFSSSVSSSGITTDLNIQDTSTSNPSLYLAGLVKKNAQLGDGSSDDKAAILARSLPTLPGASPQANEDPSINNRDAESAIWSYNRADNSLTPTWVNYAGQTPQTVVAHLSYLPNGDDKFYLSSSATTPQLQVSVAFKWISVNDGCGSG